MERLGDTDANLNELELVDVPLERCDEAAEEIDPEGCGRGFGDELLYCEGELVP
jgi:hypothetical protein